MRILFVALAVMTLSAATASAQPFPISKDPVCKAAVETLEIEYVSSGRAATYDRWAREYEKRKPAMARIAHLIYTIDDVLPEALKSQAKNLSDWSLTEQVQAFLSPWLKKWNHITCDSRNGGIEYIEGKEHFCSHQTSTSFLYRPRDVPLERWEIRVLRPDQKPHHRTLLEIQDLAVVEVCVWTAENREGPEHGGCAYIGKTYLLSNFRHSPSTIASKSLQVDLDDEDSPPPISFSNYLAAKLPASCLPINFAQWGPVASDATMKLLAPIVLSNEMQDFISKDPRAKPVF